MRKEAKAAVLKRLARVEGQVAGLTRMVSGDANEQRKKVAELMDVFARAER
jgi:hypothetical protein